MQIKEFAKEKDIDNLPSMLYSKNLNQEFYKPAWEILTRKNDWSSEFFNSRKNGKLKYHTTLFSDISEREKYKTQLAYITYYDTLTGLPNRQLLALELHKKTLQLNAQLMILLLDIDGFKKINDTYGHKIGDGLLVALSQKLQAFLQEGEILGRLNGDEFVMILKRREKKEANKILREKILKDLATPIKMEDIVLHVTASMGVCHYPQSSEVNAEQLLRQADQAMYNAKVAGKNCYHCFNIKEDKEIKIKHKNIEEIHLALIREQFILYYQPKVNMRTGEVIGVEALIRWDHPEKGILSPSEFLPIVEDHPFGIEIGKWVINTALTQMEVWNGEGLDLKVSVNIGARQLQGKSFVQDLRHFLSNHPMIAPSQLELEILETSALEDINNISSIMDRCHKIGVSFALDDFGTGYSSLTYLKNLPIDFIKIDQSFVRDMLINTNDLCIVEGIIALSKALRRQIIAEGVETIEHGKMLIQLGCEFAQGYAIARPMQPNDVFKWIEKHGV